MVSQAVFDKEAFIRRRGYLCECGCGKQGEHAHHVFIHNIKKNGKSRYKELNDWRNLVLVNGDEHIKRKFDTRAWRQRFWKMQCERYGESAMMEWVNSLPAKLSNRLDFMT